MVKKSSMFDTVLALFGASVICGSISEGAGGTALFGWIAPVFEWACGLFFLAAVLYPVYDFWKLLTTPPPPIEWE